MRSKIWFSLGLALAIPPGLGLALRAQAGLASRIEIVSASSPAITNDSGGSDSLAPVLSSSGRFLSFLSSGNDLVTNDTNGPILDLFVRNLETATTILASRNEAGTSGGDGNSTVGVFSDDDRFVAFASEAGDLVTNDFNHVGDVFVRNLETGEMILVSVNQTGRSGNGPSGAPVISRDGQFIVFESAASDLVPNDTNGTPDLFIRDLRSQTTRLVSNGAAATTPGYGAPHSAVMTPDGEFVAFVSAEINPHTSLLISGEVRLRDVSRDLTTEVSPSVAPTLPYWLAANPILSGDDEVIAFKKINSGGGRSYVVHYDFRTGQTSIVSSNAPKSDPATVDGSGPVMSADGRYIAYEMQSDQGLGIALWDSSTGIGTTINQNLAGSRQGNGPATSPLMSSDGRYVAFLSTASDLVTNDVNGRFQLFVRDVPNAVTRLISADLNGKGSLGGDIGSVSMSADGRRIAFQSRADGLVTDDHNARFDVFVWNADSGRIELASRRVDITPQMHSANGPSSLGPGSFSADGRWVVFSSDADNLVVNDTNEMTDVFVRDLQAKTNVLVSVSTGGFSPGNGVSQQPVMSPDGRWIAFLSRASNLTSIPDTNGVDDVFVRDLLTGRTILASVNASGTAAGNAASSSPCISDNGRFIAFESAASDLVVNLTSPLRRDVFVRDLLEETTSLARANPIAPFAYGSQSGNPVLSPTGRYLLFRTAGSSVGVPSPLIGWILRDLQTSSLALVLRSTPQLFAEPGNALAQFAAEDRWIALRDYAAPLSPNFGVFLYDIGSGNVERACTNCSHQTFSADGRLLAFESASSSGAAVPSQISLFNHEDQTYTLVSANASGSDGGNASSWSPAISANGRYVAFESKATDLTQVSPNRLGDVFVYDVFTRQNTALHTPGQSQASDLSLRPILSGDGETIAFLSFASDLVDGDFNETTDIFAAHLIHEDTDGDGLPDDWEMAYFGNLAHDGTADSDADGLSDAQEFAAGSNPLDAKANLSLQVITLATTGTTLSWTSIPGKFYQIQMKDDLDKGDWIDLGAPVLATSFTAAVSNAIPVASQHRYFRIQLVP